jgi:hypothetical protein
VSDESVKPWLQEGAPGGVAKLLESAAEDGPSPAALGKLSARLAAAGLLAPHGGPGGGGGDGGGGQAPHAPQAPHAGPTSAPVPTSSVAASLATPAALGAKAILLGAVGVAAVGGGAFQAGRLVERHAQEQARAVTVAKVEPVAVPAPVPPPPEPAPSEPAPEPAPKAVAPAPRPPRAPTETANPDQEAELLTRALAASGQKDWRLALAVAEQHAHRFPHGALAQEREMIAIEALLGLHRGDQAKRRADAFRKQWPTSTHLVRLNTLVPPEK